VRVILDSRRRPVYYALLVLSSREPVHMDLFSLTDETKWGNSPRTRSRSCGDRPASADLIAKRPWSAMI
jgi:hypothetical protein